MSILDYFPAGLVPRPQQRQILLEIEAAWTRSDVLVGLCPTAAGKTEIALTVARWSSSRGQDANILEPSNVLTEQVKERYPATPVMWRKSFYFKGDLNFDCQEIPESEPCGGGCGGCQHRRARTHVKKAPVRLMNFWVYLANKLYAPVAIFDEGHQIIEMLRGMHDLKLRQSDYNFPPDLQSVADVIEWAQGYLADTPDEKLSDALRWITRIAPGTSVIYDKQTFRGREEVFLAVEPASLKDTARMLWPTKVKKILLLSATIGPQDVEDLGLDTRRVTYLECDSPIPPEQRPFLYEPAYNLSYNCVPLALPLLVEKVLELLAKHPDKGLVHLPYGLAEKFRQLCPHPRLLFHTSRNKSQVLDQFRSSPPGEGKVLVASGLYEGIDLKFDEARWQLIGKVPFLSLADARIKERASRDPDWYAWSTIKLVLQAYGRIVRAADDQGTTFMCDTNFERLFKRNRKLFPKHFLAAVSGIK